jgi:hypothetical protein
MPPRYVGALGGFFDNRLPKNGRPRQDRAEAAGTAPLSDHAGVSRLTALADQAGINDFATPAPPSAACPKSNWVQLSGFTGAIT